MDVEKLYENIVLRDLFQYFTPGSVFLVGLCLFLDAVLRRLDTTFSVFGVLTGSAMGVVFAFISAYAAGNLLAGVCAFLLREDETNQTFEILKSNEWMRKQVEHLTKYYFRNVESDEAEVPLLLKTPHP